MPKLTKKIYPFRTYGRTDPNNRKASLLKTVKQYFQKNILTNFIMSLKIQKKILRLNFLTQAKHNLIFKDLFVVSLKVPTRAHKHSFTYFKNEIWSSRGFI